MGGLGSGACCPLSEGVVIIHRTIENMACFSKSLIRDESSLEPNP